MPALNVDRKVVAIDGPAGSGKSTVARAVAARLGIDYLDTGAMYRAVAFVAMRHGVDPEDAASVAKLAKDMTLEVADRVLVDGVDATIEVRSPEVTRAVSTVAANPEVRTRSSSAVSVSGASSTAAASSRAATSAPWFSPEPR